MKKLFVFAIAAGMTFVACNSGASSETTDSTTTAVDTLSAAPVDSLAATADSTVVDTSAAAADTAAHH
jgi:outer membrane murein-binding lipoprotein Lpp